MTSMKMKLKDLSDEQLLEWLIVNYRNGANAATLLHMLEALSASWSLSGRDCRLAEHVGKKQRPLATAETARVISQMRLPKL